MPVKPTISVNEDVNILEKQHKHKRNDHKTRQNKQSLCLDFINRLSHFKCLVICVSSLKYLSQGRQLRPLGMVTITSFFLFFNVKFITHYSSRDLHGSHTEKSREGNKEQKWSLGHVFSCHSIGEDDKWVNANLIARNISGNVQRPPLPTIHQNHLKTNESWSRNDADLPSKLDKGII